MDNPSRSGLAAWLTTLALAVLAAGVLLCAPTPAHAAIDCWMDAEHPLAADQRPVTDPAVAPMRQALHTIATLLHRQPALQAVVDGSPPAARSNR